MNYLFFDNQQLKSVRSCLRKWQYRHLFNRVKYDKASLAARFGQGVHKGIADFLQGASLKDATLAAIQTLNASLEEQAEWRNDQKMTAVLEACFSKELPIAVVSVPTENGTEKLIEKPFSVPILDKDNYDELVPDTDVSLREVLDTMQVDDILYSGIIDLIGSNDNGFWPVDHKTTSMLRMTAPQGGTPFIGDPFWCQFNLNCQMTGYCYSCEKLMGKRPAGFMINGIGINERHLVIERRFFMRTPEQIEDWRSSRINEIFTAISWMYRLGEGLTHWCPLNEDSCFAYNTICEYQALCLAGSSTLRRQLLETYREKPWDIFKRDAVIKEA